MTSRKQIEANRRNATKSTGPRTKKGKDRSKLNALKHGLRAREALTPDEDPLEFADFRQELTDQLEPVGRLETELVERIAIGFWRLRRCVRIEAILLLGGENVIARNEEVGLDAFIRELSLKHTGKRPPEERSNAELARELLNIDVAKYFKIAELPPGAPDNDFRREPYWFLEVIKDVEEIEKEENQRNPVTYDPAVAFKDAVCGPDVLGRLARYEVAIDRAVHRALHELQRLQALRKGKPSAPPAALDVDVSIGRK